MLVPPPTQGCLAKAKSNDNNLNSDKKSLKFAKARQAVEHDDEQDEEE